MIFLQKKELKNISMIFFNKFAQCCVNFKSAVTVETKGKTADGLKYSVSQENI